MFLRKILFPLPEDQKKQGFEPNGYIQALRLIAKTLIFVFRLNGKNRLSNEVMQMLNPTIRVTNKDNVEESFLIRTGHGRLLWRAKTFFTQEPMCLEWIRSFQKDDIFFDVGANIGTYSLFAASRGIQTYSFEAEPLNFSLMYENMFLNNLVEQMNLFSLPLHDRLCEESFFIKDLSRGDALHSVGRKSIYLAKDKQVKKYSVFTMTIDHFVETYQLKYPTKMKVDVDTNELLILKGASKVLEHLEELYIEMDLEFSEHQELKLFLESKGFSIQKEEIEKAGWTNQITNYIFVRDKNLPKTSKLFESPMSVKL